MRYIKGIRRRIGRFIRGRQYPTTIAVDINDMSIKFRIHSDTEAFRTSNFGGEREQIERYVSYLQADDVVYDIGASVGLISLISAAICSKGTIYSFEPDPEILERLQQNIDINGFNNVVTKPYIISDANGKMDLFTAGSDSVSPTLSGKNVMNLDLKPISVDSFRLDDLIEQESLVLPDVLKIDVEGAEYLVAQGAERLLSGAFGKKPRFIFLEAHPEFLTDYDVTVEDLLGKFAAHGYSIIYQESRKAEQHYFMKSTG